MSQNDNGPKDGPTNQDKLEYVEKVLNEVSRVARVMVENGQDEQMGINHPYEIVLYIVEVYGHKLVEAQKQIALEASVKANTPPADVIDFASAKNARKNTTH
jgi:hypothetical protein